MGSSLAVSRLGTAEDNDALDAIKCSSLEWLLKHEEHFGDALICSNILLRQFLLNEHEDMIDIATNFLSKYLLEDVVDRAGQARLQGLEDEFADAIDSAMPTPSREI